MTLEPREVQFSFVPDIPRTNDPRDSNGMDSNCGHAILCVTILCAADHPALINPVTGLPNIKEAVNVFPEMNDAQVCQ